jgi:hypothetical protein
MCINPYDSDGNLDMRLLPLPSVPDLFTLLDHYSNAIEIALTLEDTILVERSYPIDARDNVLIDDLDRDYRQYRARALSIYDTIIACGYLS